MTEHGFVALQGLASKQDATALFEAMDGNGGGVVLLDEWCGYLKAAEVAAHTAVGQLLSADEAGGVGKLQALPTLVGAAGAAGAAGSGGSGAAVLPPGFKPWDPAGHLAPMVRWWQGAEMLRCCCPALIRVCVCMWCLT